MIEDLEPKVGTVPDPGNWFVVAKKPKGAKGLQALSETSGSGLPTPLSERDEPSAGHAARLARIAKLLTKVT